MKKFSQKFKIYARSSFKNKHLGHTFWIHCNNNFQNDISLSKLICEYECNETNEKSQKIFHNVYTTQSSIALPMQAMTEMKIQNSQKPTNEISSHSHIYVPSAIYRVDSIM